MDAVILCGGKGTRLSEETVSKPKPMVEIGGKPILWHIMKTYSHFGVKRFILALGYKGDYIKQYFYNYKYTGADISLKLDPKEKIKFLNHSDEKHWEITFVDTGEETTGVGGGGGSTNEGESSVPEKVDIVCHDGRFIKFCR